MPKTPQDSDDAHVANSCEDSFKHHFSFNLKFASFLGVGGAGFLKDLNDLGNFVTEFADGCMDSLRPSAPT